MMGDTEPREADTALDTGHGRQIAGDKYWETNDGRQMVGSSPGGGHSP